MDSKIPDYIKPKKKVEGEVESESEEQKLAIMLTEFYAAAKGFEARAEECWADYRETEQKLVALMTARGFDLFRIAGLATFSTKSSNHPSVTQGNQEAFNQWLDENGMGAIAKRSVHPQTLKGWVNDRLKNGEELPPMVSNFPTINIHIHKLSTK